MGGGEDGVGGVAPRSPSRSGPRVRVLMGWWTQVMCRVAWRVQANSAASATGEAAAKPGLLSKGRGMQDRRSGDETSISILLFPCGADDYEYVSCIDCASLASYWRA
ncbi:hypothetical protein A5789_34785 [Nocardia sp. 852002-51101_SCH5132738]|nr:hypothetical protein A5789_34785 [Nocardia sp. 852002-51101_SCH5132738]OBF68030.1 hypothetical protein A9X06_35255 [Mycobacterium sp. 852002-51759_SCH5129042]